MIPTKKAFRPMKSPARPTNDATIDSAEATGLRKATTATPPSSMTSAKNQKRGRGMANGLTVMVGNPTADRRGNYHECSNDRHLMIFESANEDVGYQRSDGHDGD